MENIEMIRTLAKLQILCVRYVERHTSLRCRTQRDIDRVITGNKLTCTYGVAVENLYNNIKKYCKNNSYLMEEILKLKSNIDNSDIKEYRFGLQPQRKFTEIEKELDYELLKRTLYMTGCMVSIKDVLKYLGENVTESAIKQACQQERLLNTKKIGNSWVVHIPECEKYWNVSQENDSYLYKDYVY